MIAILAKDWDQDPGNENVVILADDFVDIAEFLKSPFGDHIDGIRQLNVIDRRSARFQEEQAEIDLETAALIAETNITHHIDQEDEL
jgi:hypothetical protein